MLIPKYNIILSKHYCADLSNGLTTGDIFPAQRGACAQRGAGASPQQHRAHPVLHPELHTQLPNTGCSLSCIECYVWQALSTIYSGSPSSGLKMQIVFKRRLTNELLTTYLPSLILILMCYATSFFRPIYFEAAVTVNLSILLVTTTLFIRFTQLFQSFPSIEL